MLSIKDFAETNDIDISGIYKKIKRNEKLLEGHLRIVRGVIYIDDIAQDFLIPKNKAISQKAEKEKTEIEEKYKTLIFAYQKKIENLISEKSELEQKIENLNRVLVQNSEEIEFLKNQISSFSENSKFLKLKDFFKR